MKLIAPSSPRSLSLPGLFHRLFHRSLSVNLTTLCRSVSHLEAELNKVRSLASKDKAAMRDAEERAASLLGEVNGLRREAGLLVQDSDATAAAMRRQLSSLEAERQSWYALCSRDGSHVRTGSVPRLAAAKETCKRDLLLQTRASLAARPLPSPSPSPLPPPIPGHSSLVCSNVCGTNRDAAAPPAGGFRVRAGARLTCGGFPSVIDRTSHQKFLLDKVISAAPSLAGTSAPDTNRASAPSPSQHLRRPLCASPPRDGSSGQLGCPQQIGGSTERRVALLDTQATDRGRPRAAAPRSQSPSKSPSPSNKASRLALGRAIKVFLPSEAHHPSANSAGRRVEERGGAEAAVRPRPHTQAPVEGVHRWEQGGGGG